MRMDLLNKLKENLYKHYKTLREDSFLFVEVYDGIIVLNWSPINDQYINYPKVQQMKMYMYKFLKEHGERGFFYVGPWAIEVK